MFFPPIIESANFYSMMNYLVFYKYILPKNINKIPCNYITESVVGKFPYLLISSNSEFTPIQIFYHLNSGFVGD